MHTPAMGAKGWDIPVSNMVHAHRKTEDTATVAVKKRKTTEITGSEGDGDGDGIPPNSKQGIGAENSKRA